MAAYIETMSLLPVFCYTIDKEAFVLPCFSWECGSGGGLFLLTDLMLYVLAHPCLNCMLGPRYSLLGLKMPVFE